MRSAFFIQLTLASLMLAGCAVAERLANVEPSGEERLTNGATVEPSGEVVEPSGEVIEPDGEVIPAPAAQEAESLAEESDMCLVRARHFHGLVRMPCDQIAREAAP